MTEIDIFKNAKESDDDMFDCLSDLQKSKSKLKGVIAASIFNKRHKLGMSQKQFAEHMGVSARMVSKWESAEYNFTIETLLDIFAKLSIKAELSIDSEKE